MRESILTIPISEVFEPKCGCPICRMRDMLENRTVSYIMGAAMMEPDVRIETNRLGFCKEHFTQMQAEKNRLSLALILQTHIDELRKGSFHAEKKSLSFKKSKDKKLPVIGDTCFVCSKIQWGMERLLKTFFEMYLHDDFRKLFLEQEFICLPHFNLLAEVSEIYLQKDNLKHFNDDAKLLTSGYLSSLYNDISHYCSMYDYRNTGKDADWGNSKDSIERSIKFLTSR